MQFSSFNHPNRTAPVRVTAGQQITICSVPILGNFRLGAPSEEGYKMKSKRFEVMEQPQGSILLFPNPT